VSRIARAQTYPARPVRFIVGFTPGGSFDITARLIGQWLSERLGQQFVIENRPGAAGNIASEAAVKSPADGYTILLCGVPNAISATLYDKLNYDFSRDIAPVGAVSRAPNVMVVHPSVPAKTVPEFIAYAKANPGKVNMASSGVGTSLHLSGELFKLMTGINMQHVPYRGSAPMLTDLLAGQVQIAFDNLQPSMPHINAGKLRALAVTTATRSHALPDLPTVADFVPGYEASTWNGVCAPKNTPVEIVDRLNREINAGLADPKLKARLAEVGASAFSGSPADYGKLSPRDREIGQGDPGEHQAGRYSPRGRYPIDMRSASSSARCKAVGPIALCRDPSAINRSNVRLAHHRSISPSDLIFAPVPPANCRPAQPSVANAPSRRVALGFLRSGCGADRLSPSASPPAPPPPS
jgi:tripartite-type tricarboxylate transporter receptor subunit TctC